MWRLLAEVQAANVVFLGGIALACAALLFRSQRRLRQQHVSQTAPPSPRDPSQSAAPNRLEAPLELQRFEVQMHDMARETTAQIDNKIRILEHLIRDADARIARLEAVGEWMDRSAKLDAGAGGSRDEIYALADSGHTSAEVASRLNRPVGEVELILGLRRQR